MEVAAGEPIQVQTLAQSGIKKVPSQYIQPPQNCPKHSSDSPNRIPTIDLFGLDPTRRDFVREEVRQACSDWGAFHVTNHGIPTELLRDIKRVGDAFFTETPVPEKLRYLAGPTSGLASEGYGRRMQEGDDVVLGWRDYFNHFTLPASRRDPARWPDSPEDYRSVVAEYGERVAVLARELMGLVSESLGLPTRFVEDSVGEIYQNIAMNYYPPSPQPELTLGLPPHSDLGAITLLVQDDVSGLDVFKDGQWVRVDSPDADGDAIVVLLADQIEIITNGKYRSAEHRAVTNASRARLSVVTFHNPAKSAKISPAPQLISDSAPQRYPEVVYEDYVAFWFKKGLKGKRNIDALLLHS